MDVKNNTERHRFEIEVEGKVAFAEYRLDPPDIIFPHTVTPPELEGRGIGGALVKAGMAYAREHKLAVVPTCPFFSAYLARHPEYWPQIRQDYRPKG